MISDVKNKMVELTMMTEYGLHDINVHQTMRNLG